MRSSPSRRPTLLLLLGAAAMATLPGACGDDDDDDIVTPDASPEEDGSVDAAVTPDGPPGAIDAAIDGSSACTAPVQWQFPDWIQSYEEELLGKLTGVAEIAPGITITQRRTAEARNATRDYLIAELARWGYEAELQPYDHTPPGANVIARLPATEGGGRNGEVILGGHFDGVQAGPAAADNGTGTALVVTAARYLAEVPCRSRDIVFVLFDQEESGLVGSHHFASTLVADGTAVAGVHNFDMISWDSNDDGAVELWSPGPELEELYTIAAAARGMSVSSVTFGASDHQSFISAGFEAVGVAELFNGGDSSPHYHQATDTYDKINFGYLADVTAMALVAVGLQIQ
jgi:peptidase M28-like protein